MDFEKEFILLYKHFLFGGFKITTISLLQDSLIPLKSDDYGHVDRAHHGNGVERVEEVGEYYHVD